VKQNVMKSNIPGCQCVLEHKLCLKVTSNMFMFPRQWRVRKASLRFQSAKALVKN